MNGEDDEFSVTTEVFDIDVEWISGGVKTSDLKISIVDFLLIFDASLDENLMNFLWGGLIDKERGRALIYGGIYVRQYDFYVLTFQRYISLQK